MTRIAIGQLIVVCALIGAVTTATTTAQLADPLPSWNAGKTKQSIVDFVTAVTRQGSPQFVPPAERIATSITTGRCGPNSRCISSWRLQWIA